MLFLLPFLVILPYLVEGDVYMHNPAGSNDRNCERNVNRNNGNLLFDSQNNAKGGYACRRAVAANNAQIPKDGLTPKLTFEEDSVLEVEWTAQHGCGKPKEAPPVGVGPNAPTVPAVGDRAENANVHCEIVLQMGCAATFDPRMQYSGGTETAVGQASATQNGLAAVPREGIPNSDNDAATNRIGTNDPGQAQLGTGGANGNLRFGVHETPEFYNECNRVQRNRGLFTADQNVNRRSAIGTRQNPNGGRRGLECPEERDYYPYWRPSPFLDLAYLVDDGARCGRVEPCGGATGVACQGPAGVAPNEAIFTGEWAGNAQGFQAGGATVEHGQCVLTATGKVPKANPRNAAGAAASRLYNRREWPATAAACTDLITTATAGAVEWQKSLFNAKFAQNTVPGQIAVLQNTASTGPECKTIDYSRSNHLGNSGAADTATRYTLTIPKVNANAAATRVNSNVATVGKGEPCLLRLRYNMSSSDYIRNITSAKNGDKSPIQQDPLVKVGPGNQDYVQLALNTNQYSRTFQDRSYVFYVVPKKAGRPQGSVVLNMNVRGKRGNIVQTYPAVEYDLIPSEVVADLNTVLAFQWLGSDYNPRRGCNDAEGGPYLGDRNVAQRLAQNPTVQGSNQNSRTDRTSLLLVNDAKKNYPFNTGGTPSLNPTVKQNTFFKDTAQAQKFAYADAKNQLQALQAQSNAGNKAALQCLTADQIDGINNENQQQNNPRNCAVGNAISPYFSTEEITFQQAQVGSQYLLYSARNNNFSNRDTKLKIYVKDGNTDVTTPTTPQEFVYDQKALTVTPQSSELEIAEMLESDIPGFDPVENDDYGMGAKEGCTQDVIFYAGASSQYSLVSIPVFVSLFLFY